MTYTICQNWGEICQNYILQGQEKRMKLLEKKESMAGFPCHSDKLYNHVIRK